MHHLRHHQAHEELHGAFGNDRFGQRAERIARFLGTPRYIVGQSAVVLLWITLNGVALSSGWDPYPWILLNLCFSTQAAYAAPLILLAQTRQATRDQAGEAADAKHRQEEFDRMADLLVENTRLTREVHELTEQVARLSSVIHAHICAPDAKPKPPPRRSPRKAP